MEQETLGAKEKIQILLTEYTSLRTELNARISSMYVGAGWSTVAIIWLLQQSNSYSLWIGSLVWGIGAAYCARILSFDLANAARRVREIELEVNRRAGERLLIWESERGGLNRSYWLRLFFLKRSDDYSS